MLIEFSTYGKSTYIIAEADNVLILNISNNRESELSGKQQILKHKLKTESLQNYE